MPSPWQSGLAKLDDSLQPLQSQLERLQAGLEVSDAELFHSLDQAQQNAAAVRDLILAENPDSSWIDRGSLEQVIRQLEATAREQINQQRRNKLLELASELEAGTVKHRVEARTIALNSLRLESVVELRNAASAAEQENELPGPEASEWLLWAAGLEEEKDASTVSYLRRDFPTLERFAGELDERYWKPVIRPEAQAKSAEQAAKAASASEAKPSQKTATADATVNQPIAVPAASAPASVPVENRRSYRVDKTAEVATTTPVTGEIPANSTVNMFKVPSRDRSRKKGEEPKVEELKVEPAAVETVMPETAAIEPEVVETSSGSVEEAMPSFGVLSQAKRPAAIWVAAAAGVILLCAVFAGIYRSSAKASNSPGGVPVAKTDVPPVTAPVQPVTKQAVEGTQRQTALDLERCQRVAAGNVECWGYVSNVGTDPARISLQSVDVVDGKGNTFNLHGVGQLDFATGRSSNISGGAKAKYTVTVPDKDPNAKTLTLYVDVANPHALEYTFRDIPIT